MTQPHWKMAVDVTRCIGCHACSAACKVENDIPPLGSFRTKVYCCDEGGYPQVKAISCRPCACKCEDAPCVAACRTEALPGDSMPRYVPIPSHQDLPAAWASSMAGRPRQRGAALAERTRHTHPPKSKTTSTSRSSVVGQSVRRKRRRLQYQCNSADPTITAPRQAGAVRYDLLDPARVNDDALFVKRVKGTIFSVGIVHGQFDTLVVAVIMYRCLNNSSIFSPTETSGSSRAPHHECALPRYYPTSTMRR